MSNENEVELIIIDMSDAPAATDATVSAGHCMYPEVFCPKCDVIHPAKTEIIIAFQLITMNADEYGLPLTLDLVVPLSSPLGQALADGSLTQRVRERLDELP